MRNHTHAVAATAADTESRVPRDVVRQVSLCVVMCALAASASAASAQAAQTTITVNATVVEIHCTAEQRLRIRACAPAVASIAREPAKTLTRVPVRDARGAATLMRYELRQDAARMVLVKTLLY